MNTLTYCTNSTLYAAGDAKGLLKTSMRDRFKATGLNFKVWRDMVVIKLSKEAYLRIVDGALKAASDGVITDPQISHSYFTAYSLEFTLGITGHEKINDEAYMIAMEAENLLVNNDVLRVQIELNYDENGYDYEPESAEAATQEILIAHMEAFGRPDLVDNFVSSFKQVLKKEQEVAKSSLVNWIFAADDGARDKTFQIKKTWEMDRTYYPWIESDLRTYYKSFMESRSQILVLYGPPGTGKTSFIRDMLCEMNLNSYISYDLKILTSDSTFVNYVTGSIFDAIVIEDADDLLTADREAQNKIIAKILNVSDGLIKLPRKKLIFSTNLSNVSDIDPAIIRPGRCFDVMEFRELTRDEATAAADHLGVDITEDKDKYSLAEIFFMKDVQESNDPFTLKHGDGIKKQKLGFV